MSDEFEVKDPHIKRPRVRGDMYKGEAVVLESKVPRHHITGEPYNFERGEKTMPLKHGLTPMQETFCQVYAATGSEITAYRRAGYASKGNTDEDWAKAKQYLRYKAIQKRIKEIKESHVEEYKKQYIHTVQAVVDGLWTVYERAMAAEDFAGANRALEMLGKNLNMFVEQKNLNVRAFAASGDAELMKQDIHRLAGTLGMTLGEVKQELH